MKRLMILWLGIFLLAGCAQVPFRETPLVSLESRDPAGMRDQFQRSLVDNFQSFNSVVFEYVGRQFLAIGSVEVDRKERRFKVACFNPMGVKLFELAGDDSGIKTHYVIEPLAAYGDIGTAVGSDIKKIYLDLVPPPESTIRKKEDRIIYRQASASGDLEYVFAGADGDLISKSYFVEQQLVWRVSYYEYREQSGKRYPQGIILVNRKNGYRLTVREKEFSL